MSYVYRILVYAIWQNDVLKSFEISLNESINKYNKEYLWEVTVLWVLIAKKKKKNSFVRQNSNKHYIFVQCY